MMQPFPFRIERLTDERLSDVQRLMREVLRTKLSLEQVRIKYATQHTGHQYLSSIAYDGDRPIAFYGTIPQVFTDGQGGTFVGCHVSDSMTLPDYQGKGLHQQLALTAYAWMREEGVKVVYGFHSENTFHSCKKLDWEVWGRLHGFLIDAGGMPFAKVLRRLSPLRAWHFRRVKAVLDRYAFPNSKFENSNQALGPAVEYSPAFFDSKAFRRNFWVEIDGVRFWLSVEAVIRVGDVHFADNAQFWRAMDALKAVCRRLGYQQILFQTDPGSRLHAALSERESGFESWRVGYLELLPGIDFRQYKPNYGDQDSF